MLQQGNYISVAREQYDIFVILNTVVYWYWEIQNWV
jgi:hypothetical protein